MSDTIERWHRAAANKDAAALNDLLAEEATFHSPVVHTPQVGKAITRKYLAAAFEVLNGEQFRYVREIIGERDAMPTNRPRRIAKPQCASASLWQGGRSAV
ncbi:nuclear transport factor 2 family protein [Ectothiorhodospiraceae bacterium WFHF3C12]|nr:nuclear transport factor 2 family protein [Ectothiorhodospiraceae bacterium WFHF3C12]